MAASVLRSLAKQRERDLLASHLRQAHARDPRLGRALGRLHRAWERRQREREGQQLELLDRCWWRRQERAEVMRAASVKNFSARHGAGVERTKNQ
jgi:hypothetical protein